MDWTIDTWVLYKVAEARQEACRFLERVRLCMHGVGFDLEGQIVAEYRRCLEVTRSREVKLWFKVAVSKLAIPVSGGLDPEHQEALKNLEFHNDDWPFVGVASRTQDKRLVSEESDYKAEVRTFLGRELSVSVLSVAESLAFFT